MPKPRLYRGPFLLLCSVKKGKSGIVHHVHGDDIKRLPLAAVVQPVLGPVTCAFTGPNAGVTALDTRSSAESRISDVEIADCKNWNQPSEFAFGISLSLYEEDRSAAASPPSVRPPQPRSSAELSSPVRASPVIVGDPVADVFAVQVRENVAVLALADGVGWGHKPRLAARCAVRAVMEHTLSSLSEIQERPTSHTVCRILLESVTTKAQELILEHNATLTTLSAAVVCELPQPGEWGVCVVAVGDSPVYVYCPHAQKVHDMTIGCHPHDGHRDSRMAGGTLGPSIGHRPDLENLTVAFKTVCEGDIVLCVSDGISDNFSGQAVTKMTGLVHPDIAKGRVKSCCDSILHLNEVLSKHHDEMSTHFSAQTVVAKLVNYAAEFTDQKRRFYAQCSEKGVNIKQQKNEDPDFAEQVQMLPGKLDHATAVAFQVGKHSQPLVEPL